MPIVSFLTTESRTLIVAEEMICPPNLTEYCIKRTGSLSTNMLCTHAEATRAEETRAEDSC